MTHPIRIHHKVMDDAMKQKMPRLDKSVISVSRLGEAEEEKSYWLSRSPVERWNAIELNRRLVYGASRTSSRLQRILEIVELKRR